MGLEQIAARAIKALKSQHRELTPEEFLSAFCKELKKDGRKGVYVDGGMAVSSFLRHKLLDEITITHVPILLSKGVRLFSDTGDETRMRLISTHPYQNGFVHSVYKVEK